MSATFEKLDFESYPYYASGGFIHIVRYPKLNHNLKALKQYGTIHTIKLDT